MLEATRTPSATAGRPDALLKALTRDVPLFLLSPTAAKTALVQARAIAAQYVPSSAQGAQAARAVQAATHAVVAEAAHAVARSRGADPKRAVAAAHSAVAQTAHAIARKAGKSRPAAVAAARSAVAQVAHHAARKAGASPKAAVEAAHAAVAKATHEAARRVGKTPSTAAAAARSAVAQVAHAAARKGGATPKAAAAVAKDAVKKAESIIGKETTDALKKGASDVGRAAKKIGIEQARKLVGESFSNMKLPGNLPVVLPKELTAEGVANAAYATGKKYTEDLIQSKIGIPISLPKSLSVKELGRSLSSLIPTDLSSALDMSLAVGAQVASAALTAALVGAGVGSVIPGLGTVVGIGVALGVSALKDALKSPPPPYEKPCPAPSGFKCPKPGNKSPMEILPWLAAEQERISKLIAEAQAQSYCGRGELVDCDIYLSMLAQKVIGLIGETPSVLGLPQLERLIPLYEKAPTTRYYYDPKTRKLTHSKPQRGYSQQGYAAGYMLFGKPSYKNSLGFVTPGVSAVLPAMKSRRDTLRKLLADAERPTAGNAGDLRWKLATELSNAGLQYQFDPSSENKNWFIKLANLFGKLEKFEKGQQSDRDKQQKESYKHESARLDTIAQDSKKRAEDERDQVLWLCEE
jgi:hypothetical protein